VKLKLVIIIHRWLCIFSRGRRCCSAIYSYTRLWYELAQAGGQLKTILEN